MGYSTVVVVCSTLETLLLKERTKIIAQGQTIIITMCTARALVYMVGYIVSYLGTIFLLYPN